MPANEQIQQAQGQSERFKEAGSLADLLEKAVKPRVGARTARDLTMIRRRLKRLLEGANGE